MDDLKWRTFHVHFHFIFIGSTSVGITRISVSEYACFTDLIIHQFQKIVILLRLSSFSEG